MPKKYTFDELKKLKNGEYNLERIESAIQSRFDFEWLIARISSEFAGIGSDGIDPAIDRALCAIGTFTGADRAYIFRFKNRDTQVENTHEWCAVGVEPQIENLKDILVDEELPWFAERIRNSEVFHVPDVAALPPEALLERLHFEAQKIQSLIVVPMETTERLIGFLGFDAVREHRAWGDDDKALLQFFGQTLSNVIERKETEDALKQSQRKYQNIIEKSDDLIWTVDLNLRTTYVSPSIKKKLGFTPEERMAQELEVQVTPSSYKTIMERLAQELELEEDENVDPDRIIRIETEYYHKNGSILLYENIASGLRDENGILIGMQGVSRDITEQKLAGKVLQESEEKYRLLAENAADVIYKVNIENEQYTYASPSVEKLLGYTDKEILDLKVKDLMTKESYARQRNKLIEAIEKARTDPETLELEAIHKDGHVLPVEIRVNFLYDEHGNPVEILGVARDITQHKQMEEQLRRYKEVLVELVDKRTEQLSLANEELRREITERKNKELEIDRRKKELEEMNSALEVLLHKREADKSDLEEKVISNVKSLILPYMEKLKKTVHSDDQKTYLRIIESNFDDILSPLSFKLSSKFHGLTPTEIKVANLIKNENTNKEMAEIMGVSIKTIEFHRDNIRKKLGLKKKKINLRTYLLSLP